MSKIDEIDKLPLQSLANLTILSIQQSLDSQLIDKVAEIVDSRLEKKISNAEGFDRFEIEPLCLTIGGLQVS